MIEDTEQGQTQHDPLDELVVCLVNGPTDAPVVPEGWQPIETAPKDGSVFLLGLPAIGALKDEAERRVYEGRWNDAQQAFTSVNGFILLGIATRWMPLPTAPEPTKGEE